MPPCIGFMLVTVGIKNSRVTQSNLFKYLFYQSWLSFKFICVMCVAPGAKMPWY